MPHRRSDDRKRSDENADERDRSQREDENRANPDEAKARHPRNPLSRLRFGSAGSGGAEYEPGPEKP
jgi:hypothetical protein